MRDDVEVTRYCIGGASSYVSCAKQVVPLNTESSEVAW